MTFTRTIQTWTAVLLCALGAVAVEAASSAGPASQPTSQPASQPSTAPAGPLSLYDVQAAKTAYVDALADAELGRMAQQKKITGPAAQLASTLQQMAEHDIKTYGSFLRAHDVLVPERTDGAHQFVLRNYRARDAATFARDLLNYEQADTGHTRDDLRAIREKVTNPRLRHMLDQTLADLATRGKMARASVNAPH